MVFLISLVAAVLIAVLLAKPIRKCPGAFYALCIVVSVTLAVVDFPGAPHWLSAYVLDLFRRGALGAALFVVVMFIGTLKNGSAPMKMLMPIRGYLSIMASILCLCHNVFYGRTYFVKMFTSPSGMPLNQLLAGILTIIMLVIMIPLFIMSFRKIRNRMKARTWKKYQRFAYGYYGLLYVHIMLLMIPFALRGMTKYVISIAVYSIVYALYLILRLRKSKVRSAVKRPIQVLGVAAAAAVILVSGIGCANAIAAEKEEDTFQLPPVSDAQTGEEAPVYVPYMHDGVFTGSGTGYGGKTTVSITVRDGVITEIHVDEHHDDAMYFDQATALIDDVLAAQSHEVDSVSGATSSSVGLKSAIKKAIAASMEPTEADLPGTSAAPEGTAALRDGTYSGVGAGYGGRVVVNVEIENGSIKSVQVGENREDKSYLDKASVILDEMVQQQTYAVDAVSGATVTSEALITGARRAMKDAMESVS